jgi:hypothetical protein
MKIITTSGKEYDIDFKSDNQHQQMREMIIDLKKRNAFKLLETDEERIKDIITEGKKHYPNLSSDVIEMVVKHYYKQLQNKKDLGMIDDIDIAIKLGPLMIEELEKWK